MKRQSFKLIFKRVSVTLFASFILISSNAFGLPDKPENSKPATITYKGMVENNMLAFQIEYNNTSGEKFYLQLINEDHEILYQRKYAGKSLNTKIYLTSQPPNCSITFSIISAGKTYSETFAIDSNTKTVEDYVVTKMH